MLSHSPLTLGKVWYYQQLAGNDYYGGQCEWWGRGSTEMNLIGPVKPYQFHALFEGRDPNDRQALVQNPNDSDRHVGDDVVSSAMKSVTVYVSQCEGPKQSEGIEFHNTSVSVMLKYMEDTYAFCRVGKGGQERVRARLIAANCLHLTNRENGCQIHTHTLVFTPAVRLDGKKKKGALDNRFLYSKHKKVLGAYYRANLAFLFTKNHGLSFVRKGESCEIDGIPDKLIEAHSVRRQQMKAYSKKHKLDPRSAADNARAALATRRTKRDVPTPDELWKNSRELNRKYGFTDKSLRRLVRPVKRDPQRDLQAALTAALESLHKTHTHFDHTDFLYATLLEAPERGLPPDAVVSAVADFLDNSTEIIKFRLRDGQTRYTTPRMIEEENQLIAAKKALQAAPGIRVSERIVRKVLARHPELSEEQIRAVRHIVQPTSSLAIVSALAGTGKSSKVAKVAFEMWQVAGYRVIGAAPTGKAARVLEKETGIPSETLHRRLGDYKISRRRKLKHHATMVGRAIRGKRTYRLKPPTAVKIDKRTIIAIDEFGMVNTPQGRKIFELVRNGHGMAVLLGDPFQLPPVEGSAPFHSICDRVGYAELTEVRRQKDEWARLATRLFAEGKPGDAIDLYAQHGLVTTRDTLDEALEALALDWITPGLTHPQDTIVLVDSNRRSETANKLLQQKRIDAGCLNTSASLEIIDDDTSRGVTYSNRIFVGDRLLCTRNNRRLGVENGTLGTVLALNTWRKTISVQLDDGRRTIIPVRKYPHIRLGYAMTVYKAQGSTVPHVLVLANGEKESLPLSYVEATRGVLVTRFYTEKAYLDEAREQVHESRLAKQMSRRPDLRLVTDLIAEAPPDLSERKAEARKVKQRPLRKDPIMKIAGMSTKFHVVTRPLPGSTLADICVECDATEFLSQGIHGFRPDDILGVYADKQPAVAEATKLLDALRQTPTTAVPPSYPPPPLKCVRMPSSFWVVKMPRSESAMADICLECDFRRLAAQALGGLHPTQIAGIFSDKEAAAKAASRFLEAVRPQDDLSGIPPVPSHFWLVTQPTPHSELGDICFASDLRKYAFSVLGGLRPASITAISANKKTATAIAVRLLTTAHIAGVPQERSGPMKLAGVPSRFWLVTMPTPASKLDDICRESSFTRLASEVLDGLSPLEIVGAYPNKQMGNSVAFKLLKVVREIHGIDGQKTSLPMPVSLSDINWDRLRILGFTEDYREAGFIDPTGRMIDLSGKNDGACPGHRYLDHREAGGTIGMQQLMAAGYVRFFPEFFGAHMVTPPTKDQFDRLCGLAAQNHGEITIEAHNCKRRLKSVARDG